MIYSGPGEYFVENDDTYYSILENVEYQKNRVSKVPEISTYSRLNHEFKNLQGRSVTLSQYKVKHDEFFTSDCYENCGYFNGGYCGFIGLGLLIGCQDKYHNDDIMDDEYLSKVEWDQGSMMSGAWYKTKKNKEDTYQELANQGVTKLDVYYPDYQFIQINNKGMYSLKMEYEKKYTIVDVYEMSLHRIPFPLYAIDADKKMSINSVPSSDFSNVNVDFLRTKQLINDFQNRLNVYSKIEEDENSMTLYYKDSKLILSYSDNVLNIINE